MFGITARSIARIDADAQLCFAGCHVPEQS